MATYSDPESNDLRVTSQSERAVPAKAWTVMVYMAAGQDQKTEAAAIRDIQELQQVGTTDDVNVLVQIDRSWPGYPQLYRVKANESEPIPEASLNDIRNMSSGDPKALHNFLTWSRKHAPARQYLLVLWGHAYGLGFGRDHGDQLTLKELSTALKAFGEQGTLDLLGANACAMSYAEAAFELHGTAKFLVASEITMPLAGWPYAQILKTIVERPSIPAKELGETIVSHFMESFGRRNVALTLLNLDRADKLLAPVTALAGALKYGLSNGTREQITDAFLDTAHGDVRPLIDLADLCEKLKDNTDDNVRSSARTMTTLLTDKELVVKHDADPEFEGLHGLGIFAPAVTGAADLVRLQLSEPRYQELALMRQSDQKWTTLVYEDLKEYLDPMNKAVAEFVKNSGATRTEDRTGVAQLVLSVDRSFVKLEKAIDAAERDVTGVLTDPGSYMPSTDRQRLAVAARLASPYLRLAASPWPPAYAGTLPRVEQHQVAGSVAIDDHANDSVTRQLNHIAPIAKSLADLEGALGNVERTARRVLTNAKLGLGDVEPDVKSGLGDVEPDVKSGLGDVEPDVKSGLGDVEPDVKSGLGLFPWPGATDGGLAAGGARSIAQMYRQVAWSLGLIEEAIGKLENFARSALTSPSHELHGQDVEYRTRVKQHLDQSFRDLEAMVGNAKQMARWVLAHPAYGLGPGRAGLGASGRQQLAVAGGLSSRFLRLL